MGPRLDREGSKAEGVEEGNKKDEQRVLGLSQMEDKRTGIKVISELRAEVMPGSRKWVGKGTWNH